MANIFPQGHLFTRLLAEAGAAEAARLAEAKRNSLAAAEREAELTETMLTRLAAYMGAEFVDAISPYTVVDYVTDSTFRFILVIPGHRNIHLTFDPDRWLRISGGERAEITPTDMLPFARELRSARDIYQQEAAERAHQEAIAAAQEQYEAERARVREANRAALERLQAEYDDGEFDLYALEYGILTEDGDVGRGAAMVLCEEPDDRDRWLVVHHSGKQTRERFFYPICLEGPRRYRATGRYYTRPVTVDGYGVVGYLAPTAGDERVAAYATRAAAVLQPPPELPEILNGLDI